MRPMLLRLEPRRRPLAAPHVDHLPDRLQARHRRGSCCSRASSPAWGERDFFLRKGIGWALREYAKVAPERVLWYVRDA